MQLVADATFALEAAERVDALVMTAVRVRRTFVELCSRSSSSSSSSSSSFSSPSPSSINQSINQSVPSVSVRKHGVKPPKGMNFFRNFLTTFLSRHSPESSSPWELFPFA